MKKNLRTDNIFASILVGLIIGIIISITTTYNASDWQFWFIAILGNILSSFVIFLELNKKG